MAGKELNITLPEKFRPACTTTCRYVVYHGGRGGAKTYSFAIIFLLKAMKSKIKILCVREIMSSITDSVFETIKLAMDIVGVRDLFDVTHNIITCKVTGSTFIFAGLFRNIEKIKSIPGINYVWVNEADKVSEESLQLLLPTVREEGSQCFFEFNPGYEDDPVYKRFIANTTPDSLVVEVSWRDNPFISQTLLNEKDTDFAMRPDEAAHIWDGKLKKAGAQVWSPPFDKALHVREFDLKTIKDYKIFQSLDPHTSFYSASIWFAAWKVGDRYYKWVFDEWPKHSDVNADYSDIRNKLHYTGEVKDLARSFFAKETGLTVTQRYIDTRFCKGFGSKQSNLVSTTEGLVESFAKPANGGILFLMPQERHIDEARDAIKADMRHNVLAERSSINEPCLYVSKTCTNVIRALQMHRYEEDCEKELETYKDFSDCLRIGISGFLEYRWPKKSTYNPGQGSGSWMGS
jgi:PBSX family phage terminase large subunit